MRIFKKIGIIILVNLAMLTELYSCSRLRLGALSVGAVKYLSLKSVVRENIIIDIYAVFFTDMIGTYILKHLLMIFLLRECYSFTEDEHCHSFAGGSVYPHTSSVKTVDHKLQYTTAVISKPAPYWEGTAVVNGELTELKLSDFKGKYLVFFFYPLDFTFVCPTEILAFNDRIEEFRQLNAEVVGCSVDSHFTHLAWMNTPRKEGGLGPLKIPLLSDLTHKISKDYGVYLDDAGHALRGLFIIDNKGILRQITMNDLPVGRSVDETLRLVQAFQYTDKHGEVCPAGWKPGQDTIIPDPIKKKEFFQKQTVKQ